MNAETPAAAYSTREGDLARDRDAAIAVWRATLGNTQGRDAKFDWFYRHAPEGSLLVLLTDGGDGIVGTAGVGWRRMRLGGRTLRAGLLADMAVLPAHRLLGPALLLQRTACELALREGDLVYGFPNPNAVPVVKRLGYAHAGDMVLHVRPLRHARYLARTLPAAFARPAGWLLDQALRVRDRLRHLATPRLHAAWHGTPQDPVAMDPGDAPTLHGLRDADALDWRFTRCPLATFRFLHLRCEGRADSRAWFACQRDGDTLRVADYGFERDVARASAIASLLAAAYREGCSAVAIEACLPTGDWAAWHANGFRERQRRPVYARWRDPALSATPLRLTAFDEDE